MKWIDFITIVAIAMVVGSIIMALQFYYFEEENKCMSQPLLYSARFMEQRYGLPFQGHGYFIGENVNVVVYFDSETIEIKNLG